MTMVQNEQRGKEALAVRKTAAGWVRGTAEEDTLVWYGIPYGKAPVGDLRWKAPQAAENWEGILDSSSPGEMAMQLTANGVTGTEDCLRLDIYSKAEADHWPVLVFIHGGNNQNGISLELRGTELSGNGKMVVVSVDYRLGLPGFCALPAVTQESGGTGNYTLLDIGLALDWIRENISAFGGDPENVTLSGFSAGGRDVMAMLISPLFRGKFQKAIAFSGGMTTADPKVGARTAAEYLAPLAVRDGKAEGFASAVQWLLGTASEVREWLYSLKVEEMYRLIGGASIRMAVFPHLFTDGVVLPEEGFDTELYNEVPVMMISGTTEFQGFAMHDAYLNGAECADLTEEEKEAAIRCATVYGSRMYRYFNTDASAEQMISRYHAPIYLCDINHGNADSGSPNPVSGASHGVFLPLLSKEHRKPESAPQGFYEQESYQEMSGMFVQYLKNFVQTGNPNAAGNPKTDEKASTDVLVSSENAKRELPLWPSWTKEQRQSLVLDVQNKKALAESRQYLDSYSAMINDLMNDCSLTEELKHRVIRRVLNGRWFSAALDSVHHDAHGKTICPDKSCELQ